MKITPFMRNMLLGVFVLGLVVLVYFKQERKHSTPTVQKQAKHSLVLFYAPWCGYCKQFMPEWDQVKAALQTHPFVDAIEINGDDASDLMQKYEIPGFPTVLMETADGQVIKYDGPRTANGVLEFVCQF